MILNRRNQYVNLELQGKRAISLWYDFDNGLISNLD